MRLPILLPLMIALAAYPQPASAQTSSSWVVVDRSDSTVRSIDRTRIVVGSDGIVRVWIKTDYRYGYRHRSGQIIYSDLDQQGFRCGSREWALLRWVSYARNGSVVVSGEPEFPRWYETIPESVGDATLVQACAYARRR